MPDGEKVSEVARRFGVNPQTIRQWAEQFGRYLSENATPERGTTRHFTSDDLQVLALVAYMRGRGATFDEIQGALESGQRGLMVDLARSSGLPSDTDPLQGGVSAGGYLARVEDLARNVGELSGRLSHVEGELRVEREAHSQTRESEAHHRERAAAAEERARMLEASKPTTPPAAPSVPRWALYVALLALVAIVALLAVVAWQIVQGGLV